MPLTKILARLSLATTIFGILAGCTVAPVYSGYRSAPAYVNTYPGYGYDGGPSTTIYYQPSSRRHYDNSNQHYHRNHSQQPNRGPTVFESAAKTHRDVRRSLGLPRLPGMP